MSDFKTVVDDINKLFEYDQRRLVNFLQEVFIAKTETADFTDEIKENRFSQGQICPHCSNDKIVRNGKYNEVQRYKCKKCNKTFTNFTNSPSYKSKKDKMQWIKYFKCMVEGYSIRKAAIIAEITVPTSFAWRHKILDALRSYIGVGSVAGIVEADETFFRLSYKGGHRGASSFKMPRKPFKRGPKSRPSPNEEKRKRGISSQKVAVLCAIDRTGNIMSELVCNGRLSKADANRFFSGRIEMDSTVCTDSHNAYTDLNKTCHVKLEQVEHGKYKKDIYSVQTVGSYHKKLKGWMYKFNGVSTKYLVNYLYWYKWFQLFKNDRYELMYKRMMVQAHTSYSTTKISDFKTRKAIYI